MGIINGILRGVSGFFDSMFGFDQITQNRENILANQQMNERNIKNQQLINAQNLDYARENRDYYNEINTANRMQQAGYNPNLMNMSASAAQPAFKAQALPQENFMPLQSAGAVKAAILDMMNQVKDSYYSYKIKEEQYLDMKSNRETKEAEESRKRISWFLEGDKREISSELYRYLNARMHVYYPDTGQYALDEQGYAKLSPEGQEIVNHFVSNFLANLDKTQAQNDNLVQRTENLEQYRQNLIATEERVQQQIKAGKLSESEGYQILQAILEIIKVIKK